MENKEIEVLEENAVFGITKEEYESAEVTEEVEENVSSEDK